MDGHLHSSHAGVTELAPATNSIGGAAAELRLRGLLTDALGGDAAAYHCFLKELSSHLRAFLRRRLAYLPDDIEDLVQELLLAIHNQRHTYNPALPLTPWVHAIARYKLVDFLRRRSRTEALHDPLEDDADLLARSDIDATDARRDLAKLLTRLPDRQRLPIIHTKIEGLSVAQAAVLTGMSPAAIKVGVHRGLKALAAMIRKER